MGKFQDLTGQKFDGCVYKRSLFFDFYIPLLNLCIELDGGQHDFAVDFFGGEEALLEIKKRDAIKTKYCEDNNINLIRISYIEFNNIEQVLLNNNIIKGEQNGRQDNY